jgi:O-antigen ligase
MVARLRTIQLTALAAGGLAGLVVLVQPSYAVTAVVGLAIVVFVALSVDFLPAFLVTTIFVESLAAGPGLRIGRLAAVLALAVVVYYLLAGGRTRLKPNALLLVAGAYGAWIMLSYYWADDPSRVTKTAGQYGLAIAYMLAFAVLVRTPRQLKSIFVAMVVGSLIFGVISFILHTGHLAEIRQTGFHGSANYFALYQLVILPPTLVLAAMDRKPERRPFYYTVIAFIAVSVVLSQSRMGIVILGAIAALLLLLPTRFFFAQATQKVTYAGLLLVIAALVAVAAPSGFLDRASTIVSAVNEEGDQGSGRLDLWRSAFTAFDQEPWFGLGAGNFYEEAVSLMQQTPGVRVSFIYYSAGLEGRPTHSIYLDALADLGVVGFTLFLLLLGLTGRYLYLAYRRTRRAGDLDLQRMTVAIIVMFIATAAGGVFLSIGLGKLLWIIIGLALALDAMTRRLAEESESLGPPRETRRRARLQLSGAPRRRPSPPLGPA